MSVLRFPVMNIPKHATAEYRETNMRVEAELYSYDIFENMIIMCLNLPVTTFLGKEKECSDNKAKGKITISLLFF